jgi:hypothetical protein
VEWDFVGEVIEWRGPAPHHFVAVPDDADAYLHEHLVELSYGWGCIPARVRVGASEETTALIPRAGLYLVPLKARLRRARDIDVGDVVQLRLTVDDI